MQIFSFVCLKLFINFYFHLNCFVHRKLFHFFFIKLLRVFAKYDFAKFYPNNMHDIKKKNIIQRGYSQINVYQLTFRQNYFKKLQLNSTQLSFLLKEYTNPT